MAKRMGKREKSILLRAVERSSSRLAKFISLKAPEVVIQQECRMLFERMFALWGGDLLFSKLQKFARAEWKERPRG